jgi:hypothetical protein
MIALNRITFFGWLAASTMASIADNTVVAAPAATMIPGDRGVSSPSSESHDSHLDETDPTEPDGDEQLSESNGQRLDAAISKLAEIYVRIRTPSKVLPVLLEVASAVMNLDSAEAFLKKYPIFYGTSKKEKAKVKKMESIVNGKIRSALMKQIEESETYSISEREEALKDLTPQAWNGGGARHLRNTRYFFYFCAKDKDLILSQFPDSDVPFTDEKCWFYHAIAKRCNGKTSFNSMKEYASRWNFATPIGTPSSESDIITLDRLRDEPDEVAAAAEALVMLRACDPSDHPELTIDVSAKTSDSLLYIENSKSHFFCQHLATPDGKSVAHETVFANTSIP